MQGSGTISVVCDGSKRSDVPGTVSEMVRCCSTQVFSVQGEN